MNQIEVAEQIARDASCAQGEFNQRVLAIIPYLTEHADEIERLRERCEAYKRQVEDGAIVIDGLREAADRVCWFDWSSNNDADAVAAVDDLRKLLPNHQQRTETSK